jgi:hypothetical protein
MKYSLYYVAFSCVLASIIAAEFIFNKPLRRRAAEIERETERFIHEGVESTAQSLREMTDNAFSWKVHEEISEAFDHAAHLIEKGAEIVEGALKHPGIPVTSSRN